MEDDFTGSPLRLNKKLNKYLGEKGTWNRDTIEGRAAYLTAQTVSVWQAPALDAGLLATYKQSSEVRVTDYTIDDYPHLATEAMRELFEAFRNQVLALYPVETEEFLKLYLAYKTETNFVDVVPQASRMRLSLNMAYP